jgi:hypothetical protein
MLRLPPGIAAQEIRTEGGVTGEHHTYLAVDPRRQQLLKIGTSLHESRCASKHERVRTGVSLAGNPMSISHLHALRRAHGQVMGGACHSSAESTEHVSR